MTKLIRYLGPYVGSILLIFLLLFAQAMTDLSLPDYMSRIVNVGIQQSGIQDEIPVVLRASRFEQLLRLLPVSEHNEIQNAYQLIDAAKLPEKERLAIVQTYPLASQELLFEKKPDVSLSEQAEQSLRQSLTVMALIENNLKQTGESGSDWTGKSPENLFEENNPLLQEIQEQLSVLHRSHSKQIAIAWLVSEYETIGIDLAVPQRRFILQIGGLMLAIALLGSICAVLVGLFASRMAAGIARDLRLAVFARVEALTSAEFDQFSTASLITRTTNDVQQIQMAVVMLMRILFFAPIMGIGGVFKAVNTNFSMSWIIVLAVSILICLIVLLFMLVVPRFKKIQKLVDKINLVTREFLSGLMVIRAFNTQAHEEKRFDQANQDLTRVNLFVSRLMAAAMPGMMLLMNGTAILIVWAGARQIDLGVMQVGDMMAFIQYTMQIIMSFLMLSVVFFLLPRAGVSAQRIAEVLNTQSTICDPENPEQLSRDQRGSVVFEHVTFRYPNADEDVLHDISFVALPGQTTAITGSTGCGKSTLINLIPRFYDVTSGSVQVNGVDVRNVTQHDLRDRIGYVPQKGILFTGSIRNNIIYGNKNADEAAMIDAAKTAQVIDFIQENEDGFDAPIAQGGSNVSGGQKQRLAIARALVKNPDIYIFDDSFSALDYRTDATLRKALHNETGSATRIIVAQRIATIRQAEQILVLDEGRIVGRGTHESLLRTCSVYREIAASQLSEKELAI